MEISILSKFICNLRLTIWIILSNSYNITIRKKSWRVENSKYQDLSRKKYLSSFNYYTITEFENNNKNGLRAGHFYSVADDVGILGSDARASGAISTVFLQPPLHLLESHSWSGYSDLLQRTNAADTPAHKFF